METHQTIQNIFKNDADRFAFMKEHVFQALHNPFMIDRLLELMKDPNSLIAIMAKSKAKEFNLCQKKKNSILNIFL